jgi:predicted RNase H-like nuclease (RuvC/YqgF family)
MEFAKMRDGDATLRLLIVFSVAGFLALAAGLYEVDRREKSSSATGDRNLTELDLRVQILSNQIHILTAQLDANQRQIQALSNQVQALTDRYDVRLKELEDDLSRRR